MSDISFSAKVQTLLSESGYCTDSISTDEDGDSHRIKFDRPGNRGVVYTDNGLIVMIEGERA